MNLSHSCWARPPLSVWPALLPPKTSALKSFQLAQAPGASSSGPSSGVASGSSSKSNNGSKGAEKSGGSSERPSAAGRAETGPSAGSERSGAAAERSTRTQSRTSVTERSGGADATVHSRRRTPVSTYDDDVQANARRLSR